jgi:hypothetical protein
MNNTIKLVELGQSSIGYFSKTWQDKNGDLLLVQNGGVNLIDGNQFVSNIISNIVGNLSGTYNNISIFTGNNTPPITNSGMTINTNLTDGGYIKTIDLDGGDSGAGRSIIGYDSALDSTILGGSNINITTTSMDINNGDITIYDDGNLAYVDINNGDILLFDDGNIIGLTFNNGISGIGSLIGSNNIQLESNGGIVYVVSNGNNVVINAGNRINLNSNSTLNLNGNGGINILSNSSINTTTNAEIFLNADGYISFNSNIINIGNNASNIGITDSNVVLSGNVGLSGNVFINGYEMPSSVGNEGDIMVLVSNVLTFQPPSSDGNIIANGNVIIESLDSNLSLIGNDSIYLTSNNIISNSVGDTNINASGQTFVNSNFVVTTNSGSNLVITDGYLAMINPSVSSLALDGNFVVNVPGGLISIGSLYGSIIFNDSDTYLTSTGTNDGNFTVDVGNGRIQLGVSANIISINDQYTLSSTTGNEGDVMVLNGSNQLVFQSPLPSYSGYSLSHYMWGQSNTANAGFNPSDDTSLDYWEPGILPVPCTSTLTTTGNEDYGTITITLASGNYIFTGSLLCGDDCGIFKININGGSDLTYDSYDPDLKQNYFYFSFTAINGDNTISLSCNSKNASSTGYKINPMQLGFLINRIS